MRDTFIVDTPGFPIFSDYSNDGLLWAVEHRQKLCSNPVCRRWYSLYYDSTKEELRRRGLDPDLEETKAVLSA